VLFMLPIYDNEGRMVDVSDEGAFVADIENKIDFELALKRLTDRQQQIARLSNEGYTQEEIAKKLRVHRKTIVREMSHIKKKISII
jgi:RNA polymerase sigma factor (sigma-70 family)